MKSQSLATLVAVAASLQGVVATGWLDASTKSCPGKTPVDKCEPQQWGGWNWGDLNLGDFDNYGGFDFSGGWSCKSSFGGRKRDALLPRTFGSKCITGTTHADKSSCPKIQASSVDKFSITHLQVSVEFDCDLEFHYTLPDKSTCKQKSSCKSTGTTVENTQCGGATDVTVVYPKPPKGGKPSCSIGIHSIGFDCPTTTATASTVQSTTEVTPTTTATEVTPTDVTTEVTPTTTATEVTPTDTEVVPTDVTTEVTPTTTATEVTPTTTATEVTPTDTEVVPTDVTTEVTPTTTATEVTPTDVTTDVTPTDVTTEVTPTDITTEVTPTDVTTDVVPTETSTEVTLTTIVTDVTVTSCPVTITHVTSGLTSIETTLTTSTVVLTSTKTFCPKCTRTTPSGPEETGGVPSTTEGTEPTGVPSTTEGTEPTDVPSTTEGTEPTDTTVAPPQTTSTTPGGDSGLPCPEVLPQCIKTWLPTGCKSNSDVACFCPKADFTKNLFACLSAFGASDDEINEAAEFFQGICAPYVPTNPGIVTDCPTKGVDTTATQKPHTVPVTTIIVQTTVTVPCAPTGTATESSFTVTTISTQVTVPQVVLTTASSDVIVVTGPATVEATATGNLPVYTTPAGVVPTFTTSRAGVVGGTGTGGLPQATQPAFVPGSASKSAVSAGVLGAVMALVALVV